MVNQNESALIVTHVRRLTDYLNLLLWAGPSVDHTIGDKTGHYVYVDATNGPDYDYAYLVRQSTSLALH